MDKVGEHIIDVLANKMNKAGGVIEGIDGIVDFEEILNSRQKMADEIVKEASKTDVDSRDIVAEIKKEIGDRSADNSKLKGQMAEVERAIKERMAEGHTPSHAVIEDNGVKIVDRDDGDER